MDREQRKEQNILQYPPLHTRCLYIILADLSKNRHLIQTRGRQKTKYGAKTNNVLRFASRISKCISWVQYSTTFNSINAKYCAKHVHKTKNIKWLLIVTEKLKNKNKETITKFWIWLWTFFLNKCGFCSVQAYLFTSHIRISATKVKFGVLKFSIDINLG